VSDAFDLCRDFGIEIVHVTVRLPRPVLFERALRLAFVSGGLDVDALEKAADWLLMAALCRPVDRSR
jgi:hypothetical protein